MGKKLNKNKQYQPDAERCLKQREGTRGNTKLVHDRKEQYLALQHIIIIALLLFIFHIHIRIRFLLPLLFRGSL